MYITTSYTCTCIYECTCKCCIEPLDTHAVWMNKPSITSSYNGWTSWNGTVILGLRHTILWILYADHVGRTWLLGLPRKQNGCPVECMTYLTLISLLNGDFSTYEGLSMVSTNDGKASWTVSGCQKHWQDTKLASGKIANCSYSYTTL